MTRHDVLLDMTGHDTLLDITRHDVLLDMTRRDTDAGTLAMWRPGGRAIAIIGPIMTI